MKCSIDIKGTFDTGYRYYYHDHFKNNTNEAEMVPGTQMADNVTTNIMTTKSRKIFHLNGMLNNSIYVLTYDQWKNHLNTIATNK